MARARTLAVLKQSEATNEFARMRSYLEQLWGAVVLSPLVTTTMLVRTSCRSSFTLVFVRVD